MNAVSPRPITKSRRRKSPGHFQTTLKQPICALGTGLHSGAPVRLTLKPGAPDSGFIFRRTDLPEGENLITGRWDRVVDTRLCTVIGNQAGHTISTIEHLMAALAGAQIDNCLVEVDGPEVPIMDGSSEPFAFLIRCAGRVSQPAPRRALMITRPVEVTDGAARASLWPAPARSLAVSIDFDSRAIGQQAAALDLGEGSFDAIAEARTFGFAREVDHLRRLGLARGGSLDNAIVVDGDQVLNPEGLRSPDEFARHKLLDAVGDLALAGAPLIGRFEGHRSGHALNNQLLRALFADHRATVEIDYDEIADAFGSKEPARLTA